MHDAGKIIGNGLNTAKLLAKTQQGHIFLESAIGKGTKVTMKIKVRRLIVIDASVDLESLRNRPLAIHNGPSTETSSQMRALMQSLAKISSSSSSLTKS